jgi:hypothetical protein
VSDPRQREFDVLRLLDDVLWLRPMDIDGRDGSHHSDTLARLIKRGLAERQSRGGRSKTAWAYLRTPAGRTAAVGERPIDRLAR